MAVNYPPILQWQDLAERYDASLIVGNGGSVAVAQSFSYTSLYHAAHAGGHLGNGVENVFQGFQTEDFELVLRRLWQAMLVNQALGIEHGRVEEAYTAVRDALIRTIRDTHPTYDQALPHLAPIHRFMRRFDTVISLNYDLVVYWAAMLGNQELGNWFKDGFNAALFQENWRDYREPYGAGGTTMFFYPHGNLALARTARDKEIKVIAQGAGRDLLETIFGRWTNASVAPLFVCEGTAERKRLAIGQSNYLRTVFDEPMSELGESVVIYGWGMGDQDAHIIEALRRSQPGRVAVSIHREDRALIDRALQLLRSVSGEIEFFDAASAGCWNAG